MMSEDRIFHDAQRHHFDFCAHGLQRGAVPRVRFRACQYARGAGQHAPFQPGSGTVEQRDRTRAAFDRDVGLPLHYPPAASRRGRCERGQCQWVRPLDVQHVRAEFAQGAAQRQRKRRRDGQEKHLSQGTREEDRVVARGQGSRGAGVRAREHRDLHTLAALGRCELVDVALDAARRARWKLRDVQDPHGQSRRGCLTSCSRIAMRCAR